ncbi:Alternative oxidase, mitochondrial precursor [Saitozyma podzolica]|uniref:Alternative oxidase n=1 Tax=Saitozyma podzolica TaxID=1890683 RepID=A0A427YN97_9TREE|nr:Alternative oxidase, mitochondrial precursor [Saitozyma podzolica]
MPRSHSGPADIVSHDKGDWTLFNPIYNQADLDCVQVVGRTPVTLSDKLAHGAVKTLRRIFDFCTGYKNTHISDLTLKQDPIPIKELRAKGELLSDKDWLLRIILLESFAGVPGMIAGTLRHLRSLRLLRRDGGWIHTLLEEAENERMHLLTFMTIAQPTWFTRALVLACQGMAYNMLFLTYIFAPKVVHRFVGALEEEAVRTYTHCLQDIERGLVPEWNNAPAPRIAIDYWRLSTSATLLDVIKAVRADEATHRFVNHSLANLDQTLDFNPFALAEPSAEIRGTKASFTREESADFARRTQQSLLAAGEQNHLTDFEVPVAVAVGLQQLTPAHPASRPEQDNNSSRLPNKYLGSVADHKAHHRPTSNLPFHPMVLSLGGLRNVSTTMVFASWKQIMTRGTYNLMLKRLSLCLLQARVRIFELPFAVNHDDEPDPLTLGYLNNTYMYTGLNLPTFQQIVALSQGQNKVLAAMSGHNRGESWCARSKVSSGISLCFDGHSG